MTTIYWSCLIGGFALTALLLVAGEVLEAVLDAIDGVLDAFDPLTAVAAVTFFGAAGLILDATLALGDLPEASAAAAIGFVLAFGLHVVYIKPMRRSENSTAFSQREYAGKTGELVTGIPAGGFGEVVVRMGASTTFQTAASFSGDPIPTGTRVVVVEVARDGVLLVAPLDRDDLMPLPEATAPRLQTRA